MEVDKKEKNKESEKKKVSEREKERERKRVGERGVKKTNERREGELKMVE